METKQTVENIEETFLTGLSGIVKISETFTKPWHYRVPRYSIIAAIITPILCMICKLDIQPLIFDMQAQMIVFLPCILGFTIAGYALVVGFVQSNMLNKITEPAKDSKFSLYQKMSSKFAINVILQGIALIFAYLYHFIMYFDANNKLGLNFPAGLIFTINFIGLLILTFWLTISILLVIQIVVNIFNFSQLHHYFINIGKVRDKESKSKSSEV